MPSSNEERASGGAPLGSILHFVASLPDLAQANCGMVAVENGERRAYVADDRPRPQSEKLILNRMRFHSALLQRDDSPLFQIFIRPFSLDELARKVTMAKLVTIRKVITSRPGLFFCCLREQRRRFEASTTNIVWATA